jgi:DNA-binding CsgD family transcriptional regulator
MILTMQTGVALSERWSALLGSTGGRYSVAVLAVGAAWLVRATVLTDAASRSPFLAFGLAVLITALAAGFGPGLLATLMSSAIAVLFYLPPELALAIHDPFDGLQLGFFVGEGVAAACAGGLIRGAAETRGRRSSRDRLAALLQKVQPPRDHHLGHVDQPVEAPTEREREIAQLLALGYSNEEMAAALFISVNTVKSHLKSLYGKLGARSRTDAVVRCIALGLLDSAARGDARGDSDTSQSGQVG